MFINSTLPNFDGDFCLDFATARLILPPAAFAVEFIITAAQMFDHLGEREVVPIFAYEGGENLRFRRVEFLAAEHATSNRYFTVSFSIAQTSRLSLMMTAAGKDMLLTTSQIYFETTVN